MLDLRDWPLKLRQMSHHLGSGSAIVSFGTRCRARPSRQGSCLLEGEMLDTWTKAAPTLLLLLVFTGCSDSPSSPEARPIGNPMVSGPEARGSGSRVAGGVSLG